jgi:hypothetical protein
MERPFFLTCVAEGVEAPHYPEGYDNCLFPCTNNFYVLLSSNWIGKIEVTVRTMRT